MEGAPQNKESAPKKIAKAAAILAAGFITGHAMNDSGKLKQSPTIESVNYSPFAKMPESENLIDLTNLNAEELKVYMDTHPVIPVEYEDPTSGPFDAAIDKEGQRLRQQEREQARLRQQTHPEEAARQAAFQSSLDLIKKMRENDID
jgi:hypothetical protein